MTYGTAPRTQAEWDAKRAEVKTEAAEVVKSNAEEARDNLAALRAEAGYPEPVVRNEVGEVEAAEAAVDVLAEEQEAELTPEGHPIDPAAPTVPAPAGTEDTNDE